MSTETEKILVPEEQSGVISNSADAQTTTPATEQPATSQAEQNAAAIENEPEEVTSSVDFTDEEAELAANAPEFELEGEDESSAIDEAPKENASTTDYNGNFSSGIHQIFNLFCNRYTGCLVKTGPLVSCQSLTA